MGLSAKRHRHPPPCITAQQERGKNPMEASTDSQIPAVIDPPMLRKQLHQVVHKIQKNAQRRS